MSLTTDRIGKSARPELYFASFAFTAAAVAVGYAIQIANGHLNGLALVLLTVALAMTGAGLAGPYFRAFERHGSKILFLAGAAGGALQFWSMFRKPPGIYLKLSDPGLYLVYLGGIGLAAAVIVCGVLQGRPKVWLPLLACVHIAIGVWMIRVSPSPRIDVFYNQNAACGALLQGHNPYTVTYPDIYAHTQRSDSGPPLVTKVYGYPPVSYLCAIPGYLAGDIRYSQLVAMSVTALLFGLARPTQWSALIGALFLFTPRTFFVLEQSWTEPFILLFFAAVLFCKIRGHGRLLPIFLGLLVASKQHMFLTIPAIALLLNGLSFRWKEYTRLAGPSILIAGAVTLPFFFWNPQAFYSVLSNFSKVSLRADSLSYPAWLVLHHGPYLSPALDVTISMATLAFALWLLPRSPSGFAAAAAVTYLVLALFSIGAFCNYYYMILGLLCMAVATASPDERWTAA